MARFQHLPLYQATYGLCLLAYRLKLKMPKNLKHDAGESFVNNCLKCLKIIVIANQLQEKKKHLDMLYFEVEMLWVSSRLLLDMRGITSGEFKLISDDIEEAVYNAIREDSKDELTDDGTDWKYVIRGNNDNGDKDIRLVVVYLKDPKMLLITVIDKNN